MTIFRKAEESTVIDKNPVISEGEWNSRLQGWFITRCTVVDSSNIGLLAVKSLVEEELEDLEEWEIPKRLLQLRLGAEPGRQIGSAKLDGYSQPLLGSCNRPASQLLVITKNSEVYATGGGNKGMERVARENGNGITPTRIVNIGGHAFATGLDRGVYKRTDFGRWEIFNNAGIPAPQSVFIDVMQSTEQTINLGFRDLDGPNESLLYAVGGKGDVWRFDGQRWHQCDFPSNERLSTVTVAADGEVYITGEGGSLWIGREDSWRRAVPTGGWDFWEDSVWFANRLWLCSSYRLLTWNGSELVRPEYNGDVVPYVGSMAAGDGCLVIASGKYAHSFDGEHWRCLVAPYS
jgi:hypothetical protein